MPWLVGMTYKAVRTDRYKYIHWVNRGTRRRARRALRPRPRSVRAEEPQPQPRVRAGARQAAPRTAEARRRGAGAVGPSCGRYGPRSVHCRVGGWHSLPAPRAGRTLSRSFAPTGRNTLPNGHVVGRHHGTGTGQLQTVRVAAQIARKRPSPTTFFARRIRCLGVWPSYHPTVTVRRTDRQRNGNPRRCR